ncbi:DEAD/DEAH box helicase [Desulfocurvus sp.]|uniref:DEAD/DEAH box helicase n=1 Tax=Desulfocurvus sp. TaxID=2871698 RepID=UPI0034478964|nr:DEAD/DEAH box helicase [Desulfocurvus sp.]
MTFDSFAFDARIASGIRAAGYVVPTPIQTQAIPVVLQGRDVMGLAQTGTGKTAAFALPILQRLLDAGAPGRGPLRVLVLAPTRELAVQIQETFVTLGAQTGIRCASVFGGVGVTPQVKALRQSTVAVACPGRLLDLMNRGEANISGVDVLVLDEADRMLDMGFLPDIKRILAKLPTRRQNLLFSATMPEEIATLCRGILRDPVRVEVANTAPAASVGHALYPVRKHLKAALLETILRGTEHDCVLVFTRTKHRAKTLAQQLERKGWAATFLQGNLSQNRRQKALDGFRSGDYRIMVATDIAARGIDCSRVTHVVNFDMPDTAETYTHRIGRTGRAERSGEALSLVTAEDGLMVRCVEGLLGRKIRRVTVEGFDYDRETPGAPSPVDEREGQERGRRGGQRGGQRPARAPKAPQAAPAWGAASERDDTYRDPDAGQSRRARGENPRRDEERAGGRGGRSGAPAKARGAKGNGIFPALGKGGARGESRGGSGHAGPARAAGWDDDARGNRVAAPRGRRDDDTRGNRAQRPDVDGNRAARSEGRDGGARGAGRQERDGRGNAVVQRQGKGAAGRTRDDARGNVAPRGEGGRSGRGGKGAGRPGDDDRRGRGRGPRSQAR